MIVRNKILWFLSTLAVLIILAVHMESLLAIIRPGNDVWDHIRQQLLWGYTANTVSVVALSMIISGIIGTLSAYLVSCFGFPFRKILSVLLYLPLAAPPYIMAYVYFNMLGPFGLVHNAFGVRLILSPFWHAILVFTLSLFPYVYIGVKGYISHGMSSHIENARLLGKNECQIFFMVILPIAKTPIFTGMVLVGLEVLGDFAASHYLGINTFATAIFRSWMVFRDFDSALRLSGFAMISVFALLILRGMLLRYKYSGSTNAKSSQVSRKKLTGKGIIFPLFFPVLVIFFALGLPLYRLITWAVMGFANVRFEQMTEMLFNGVVISFLVTLIILTLAFVIATYTRTSPKLLAMLYGRVTLISYALPGAVVAMVTLFFFIRINAFVPMALTTSIVMLIVGYVIRFLGLAYENIENGYKKIGRRHHEAARTLGQRDYQAMIKVDLPILKPFIISGMALVFIDLVRELPVTLVLRPFNFHTLATQVYQYASDEMLPESAVPSLIIIGISMIFILVLLRNSRSGSV